MQVYNCTASLQLYCKFNTVLQGCNCTASLKLYDKFTTILQVYTVLQVYNCTASLQFCTVSLQLNCKSATDLQVCNFTVSLRLYCKFKTVLQVCNWTAILQLYCKFATVLQVCNCSASLQLYCKFANVLQLFQGADQSWPSSRNSISSLEVSMETTFLFKQGRIVHRSGLNNEDNKNLNKK